MHKRLGTAMLSFVVVAAFIIGIMSYSASRLFGSAYNTLGSFSDDTIAKNYAMSLIEQYRRGNVADIPNIPRREIADKSGFQESVSYEDKDGMRFVTIRVYRGNESSPCSEFVIRKSLSNGSPDAKVLYQESGTNAGASVSQKTMTDTYLAKEDAVKRVDGQAIGSRTQGVYMGSTVKATDNVFRMQQSDASNNIAVITEEKDATTGRIMKYFDSFDKSLVLLGIDMSDKSNSNNGYIKFGEDLLFAWKNATLTGTYEYKTVTKPYKFKTLYSGMFDTNQSDQVSTLTGVWANMRTTDTQDVYYMDSTQSSEQVNLFWFGYTGKKELAEIPIPMRNIKVASTANQQIVVRVEDIYGTFYTLTSGQSGNFPEGSSFSVVVNPSSHYVAGTPNIREGLVYGDTEITASAAVLEKFNFNIPETPNQTVKVTAVDAQTKQTVIIKSGELGTLSYGSEWIASVIPDDGYIPGRVSPTNGKITGPVDLKVTSAIKKSPESWNYFAYCSAHTSYDTLNGVQTNCSIPLDRSVVYYTFAVDKAGYYSLNCKIWAKTSHNHSSSSPANSYFNISFITGDQTIVTTGNVNGYYVPLINYDADYGAACGMMDFGSGTVYLEEGWHVVNLRNRLWQINNKHAALWVEKMLITPTFLHS